MKKEFRLYVINEVPLEKVKQEEFHGQIGHLQRLLLIV